MARLMRRKLAEHGNLDSSIVAIHNQVATSPPIPITATNTLGLLGPNPTPLLALPAPILIRQLSGAKLKDRHAKGFCYYCDEKYRWDHRCAKPQLFMIIDSTDETDLHLENKIYLLDQPQPLVKMLKLGPKEMKGQTWDEKGYSKVKEILISHQQDVINSIQSTCSTDGEIFPSQTHGEPTGLKFKTVKFDSGEFLTSVSGDYKEGRLASIVFGTNKRTYGPFGRTRSRCTPDRSLYDEFCYEFGPRDCFGGFHGSVDGGSVHAMGVYVKLYVANAYDDESGFYVANDLGKPKELFLFLVKNVSRLNGWFD
ncbi:uncharacterized protein LOC143531935 [Bidens hawaiensis]|uniref:uncharacterized protein LOC143531935 n=1 Tax=Bidens hawaiensis TaxID=980011 RepID=UPI00404B871F